MFLHQIPAAELYPAVSAGVSWGMIVQENREELSFKTECEMLTLP